MESFKKTILFCTIFNLFFEYSCRGINELIAKPFLFLALLTIYTTLFMMLEDLITRFRFEDKHMILLACCFGSIYVCVLSSAVFIINPWFFGVNLGTLLFVSIVWWAFYQTLFPFYLAHRLFSRDWEHKFLSNKKWSIILGLNIFAIFLFMLSPATVFGTPIGYITMIIIASFFALLLKRSLKKRDMKQNKVKFVGDIKDDYYESHMNNLDTKRIKIESIKKIKILDILGIISFGLMGFSAIFLTFDSIQVGSSTVNATALIIITGWTFLIMFVEIFLIWIIKKKIPI